MAMYGGSGTIGNSGLLKNPSATNQAICCIMFGDKIVPDFGFYYIRAIRPYWMIYAVGTRKDPNISQAVVAEMPITIPAVSEQKSIVQYLDKNVTIIESLIAEKETLVAELESYKKSLIFEVVTGKRKVV
jgi:type I restriction enzyme S subunit